MGIVKTGTTTLGLVYKDGVILAADRRATADHIVANKNAEKVMARLLQASCKGRGYNSNRSHNIKAQS